jgi:protein SCO1/2
MRVAVPVVQSEEQFAEFVDAAASNPSCHELLAELLHENHPVYNQRSYAATVRMRGWILLALARTGVSDRELPFLLEEFDAGTDPYLIAAAATALQAYSNPNPALTPYIMRALANIRDEPVSFEGYGSYDTSSTGTTAARELLAALQRLGPHARSALPELAALQARGGRFSREVRLQLDRTIASIRKDVRKQGTRPDACCALLEGLSQRWRILGDRRRPESVDSIIFEDQNGSTFPFRNFFQGCPSIVVFFYTRCDNPWKCSLTIAKLARIQMLLNERGLADRVRTAAITYDPAFDLAHRLRVYGIERSLRLDDNHRMLRAVEGSKELQRYFQLGVNFVESLVNRHRIELYILDAEGRIAVSFTRLHWEEARVVERAIEVLEERKPPSAATGLIGAAASIACAFIPKCPVCWAAYLSVFGMDGVLTSPYFSRMQPVLPALLLINVLSVWFRTNRSGRRSAFYIVIAAHLLILSSFYLSWDVGMNWGIAFSIVASLWSIPTAIPALRAVKT